MDGDQLWDDSTTEQTVDVSMLLYDLGPNNYSDNFDQAYPYQVDGTTEWKIEIPTGIPSIAKMTIRRLYTKVGDPVLTTVPSSDWSEVTLPNGGLEDQVLAKASNDDGDVEWVTISGGGTNPVLDLEDLNDVASGATANQILEYNGTTWVPVTRLQAVAAGITPAYSKLIQVADDIRLTSTPTSTPSTCPLQNFSSGTT